MQHTAKKTAEDSRFLATLPPCNPESNFHLSQTPDEASAVALKTRVNRGRNGACNGNVAVVWRCRSAIRVGIAPTGGGKQSLARMAFTAYRDMDFFSESGLSTQVGASKQFWPVALVKELIDNALDGCEATDVPPEIDVILEADAVIVNDNGPGLKSEIIERALDYKIRVSDKKHYVSPTRGAQGNALKTVWAAPFVANGERAQIEITACGLHHNIEVKLDRMSQRPVISHRTRPSVKKGTSLRLGWTGIACLKTHGFDAEFYRGPFPDALRNLIADFSIFNPHASFRLTLPNKKRFTFPATNPTWPKWRTSYPTSPHWYSPTDLRALIIAYVNDGKRRTLRDFVGEFDGLSGTQCRKKILAELGMPATYLADLVIDGDVNLATVERLLVAMQRKSRPVKPARLGIIGAEHLRAAFVARGISAEGFKYQRAVGTEDGLPFVVEVAFGVREEGLRDLIIGLNNSPVRKVPSGFLSDVLSDCHVQSHDPVTLLIHQSCPRFVFTSHGKDAIA